MHLNQMQLLNPTFGRHTASVATLQRFTLQASSVLALLQKLLAAGLPCHCASPSKPQPFLQPLPSAWQLADSAAHPDSV